MGGGQSTVQVQYPGNDEMALLASQTSFSLGGVQALYELYESMSSCKVDLSGSEVDKGLKISQQEFVTALFNYKNIDDLFAKWETEFVLAKNVKKENIFGKMIFRHFDLNKKGVIGFGDFVRALNVFHPNVPKEAKIDFAFKLFDFDNTGFIERHAVKEMVIAVLSEGDMKLADEAIEAMLDKTFSEIDINQDGKIDKTEWQIFVYKTPQVLNFMTVSHLSDVTALFPSFVFKSKFPESDL